LLIVTLCGQKVLERKVSINSTQEIATKKQNANKSDAKENLIILLLINEGQAVYQKIRNDILPEDFKDERNKKIAKILYEELEKGDISNVIGLFENNEDLVSHITYILSKELDITDVDKAIEELTNKFLKEKLLEEKSKILKELISGNLDAEETKRIENRLKEISKKLVSLK